MGQTGRFEGYSQMHCITMCISTGTQMSLNVDDLNFLPKVDWRKWSETWSHLRGFSWSVMVRMYVLYMGIKVRIGLKNIFRWRVTFSCGLKWFTMSLDVESVLCHHCCIIDVGQGLHRSGFDAELYYASSLMEIFFFLWRQLKVNGNWFQNVLAWFSITNHYGPFHIYLKYNISCFWVGVEGS